jgi:23S rRNA (cytosine1962-C5)-methyltransferase
VIVEHGVRHEVRPFAGHKTGFYLDQRPARALVQGLAKGRAVLDLFCYQGAFARNALRGGAASVLAVDESADALAVAAAAAAADGAAGLTTVQDNVFDVLRGQREANASFGLIVLDPPAFAKSRRELDGALRGYRDLNRQALRLLAPGGWLVTCTCSHHVTRERFEEIVRQAAAGLPFHVVLRQRLGAGPDHPVPVTHPESEYLKVLVLQRLDP